MSKMSTQPMKDKLSLKQLQPDNNAIKMQAEITLSPEVIKEAAKEVVELLKPISLSKQEPDVIFNVQELAKYLKVSTKWIYERTHLKEMPHLKIDGLLRFRKKDIDKWLNSYSVPIIKEKPNP